MAAKEAIKSPRRRRRVSQAKLMKLAKMKSSPKKKPTTCATPTPDPVLLKGSKGGKDRSVTFGPTTTVETTPPRKKRRNETEDAASPAPMSLKKADSILQDLNRKREQNAADSSSEVKSESDLQSDDGESDESEPQKEETSDDEAKDDDVEGNEPEQAADRSEDDGSANEENEDDGSSQAEESEASAAEDPEQSSASYEDDDDDDHECEDDLGDSQGDSEADSEPVTNDEKPESAKANKDKKKAKDDEKPESAEAKKEKKKTAKDDEKPESAKVKKEKKKAKDDEKPESAEAPKEKKKAKDDEKPESAEAPKEKKNAKDDEKPESAKANKEKKKAKDDEKPESAEAKKEKKAKDEKPESAEAQKEKKKAKDDEKPESAKEKKEKKKAKDDEKPESATANKEKKKAKDDEKPESAEASMEKKKAKDDEKPEPDRKRKLGAEEASGLPNSSSHHTEYMRYKRWLKNKKRFPSALTQRLGNEEGRMKLFADYIEAGGDVDKILIKHEQQLREAQRSKIRYGFRSEKWIKETHGDTKAANIIERKKKQGLFIADPESPEDSLYYCFIEINIDDLRELQRITKMEISGKIDEGTLKAFTEAGGVLDPSKQQLNLAAGGPAAAGMAKALQLSGGTTKKAKGNNKGKRDDKGPARVTADSPLAKAKILVNNVLRDKNTCRDLAFKLKPLNLSKTLIEQLLALEKVFSQKASILQKLVAANKNKNKHYKKITEEINQLRETAKERVDLAKAFIRASEKGKKNDKSKPDGDKDK